MDSAAASAAILTARRLADRMREGAAGRDAARRFPFEELAAVRESGLLGVLVATEHGGEGLPLSVHLRIVRELAAGDPNVAQMYHGHGVGIRIVDQLPDLDQRNEFHARAARGELFWANAYSEITTKTALNFSVTARRDGGRWLLSGSKFYCTGSHGSDELFVSAVDRGSGEEPETLLLFVPTRADGVKLHDDWVAIGQRTTSSGTVTFDDVVVPGERVMSHQAVYGATASPRSLLTQSGFSAVHVGIARNALADTVDYLRRRARPFAYSGVDAATADPYVLHNVGRASCELDAADAAFERSLALVDRVDELGTEEARGEAAVAVARAKAVTTEAVLAITQRLFQTCGAGSTMGEARFDRHWRNARTITLHDPVDYKFRIVGEYEATGKFPEVTPYS